MEEGIAKARQAGFNVYIFESYRSPARQDFLYAQGRGKPGPVVTKAKAWQSWHQYGLAVDLAVRVDGQWSWAFDPAALAQVFQGLPVTWGGPKDGPHYQWGKLPTLALAEAVVRSQGCLRLWQEIEAMT